MPYMYHHALLLLLRWRVYDAFVLPVYCAWVVFGFGMMATDDISKAR